MALEALKELEQLQQILLCKSVKFGDFVLASGQRSDVYVDCKPTTCNASAMPLIGRAVLGKMRSRGWFPEAVGGLMVGAEPIAFAVARESLDMQPNVDAFIVRKEAKGHGMKKVVEGIDPMIGRKVVIIDDVCTKGESTALAGLAPSPGRKKPHRLGGYWHYRHGCSFLSPDNGRHPI